MGTFRPRASMDLASQGMAVGRRNQTRRKTSVQKVIGALRARINPNVPNPMADQSKVAAALKLAESVRGNNNNNNSKMNALSRRQAGAQRRKTSMQRRMQLGVGFEDKQEMTTSSRSSADAIAEVPLAQRQQLRRKTSVQGRLALDTEEPTLPVTTGLRIAQAEGQGQGHVGEGSLRSRRKTSIQLS